MQVLHIVGARPNFMKVAPVMRAFQLCKSVQQTLIHTGQHYDDNMSAVFFDELEIPQPHHHLGVGSGTHGAQTGRMLEAIEQVLLQVQPHWVVVYGDTNSTLAGALAGVKLALPVAHVEAGLRSFNPSMPEEINRILTDHASDILFPPTATAVGNLKREGVSEQKIRLVGDVMYDAALYYGARAESRSHILTQLGLRPREYILATVHRAENTDTLSRLQTIFEALSQIAREVPVILPLHPRTRSVLQHEDAVAQVARQIHFIQPVGYLDMVMLEKNARLIATDSGGVQKEAFFYRTPCVTLREETEWTELVELGWNRLAPPFRVGAVVATIQSVLAHPRGDEGTPYGKGDSAVQISQFLQERM